MAVRKTRSKGRTSSRKAPADAIQLLKKDHEKVRGLLSELEDASGEKRRSSLLERIAAEVRVHAAVEEEILYPAFLEAAEEDEDSKLFYEAREEHGVVTNYLLEIEQASTEGEEFAARAKVLKDLIEHHAEEEEKELMPRMRKLVSKDELRRLGEQIAGRKAELQSEVASGMNHRR